jgi:predicted dehydrogenase
MLRCGVAGLRRGQQFIDAFSRLPGCQVVAACDPSAPARQRVEGLTTHERYEDLLDEKLDIVAVISPGPVHAAQTLAALDRGVHVLCETPCVYSIEEAQAVARKVARSGLKYMLAENYLWMGWFTLLQEMAAEGEFGEIVYAEGDYTHDCRDLMLTDEGGYVPYADRAAHPDARPTWRATDLPPIQYCSHTLGPILRLLEDRAVSACALAVSGKGAPGVVAADLESALLSTSRGAVIRLTNGFTLAHPMALYYSVVGTRGSAKVLAAGGTTFKCWTQAAGKPQRWEDLSVEFGPRRDGRDSVDVMVEQFVDSVRHDTEPPVGLHESMDMTLPGIVAHQSGMQDGVKLAVPDPRAWR